MENRQRPIRPYVSGTLLEYEKDKLRSYVRGMSNEELFVVYDEIQNQIMLRGLRQNDWSEEVNKEDNEGDREGNIS